MRSAEHQTPFRAQPSILLRWGVLVGVGLASLAHADNFAAVGYDAGQDELVVTMAYRGTNPDHTFSLNWGPCQTPAGGSEQELAAEVLDSQAQDAARQSFKKTTRFSLADIPCRPVKLTLRTAPRFICTLRIPGKRR